ITAMSAAEENREIFAVPGNISSPTAAGPNKLIKLGANIVTTAQDILGNFSIKSARQHCDNKKNLPESAEEKIIIDCLSAGPLHIDEIIGQCKLNTSIINSVLTLLVMKGIIHDLDGQNYSLARS
ncbi:MAG: protecting protein DprA protein, partial [Candidatus Giovannonibacteria bacterium GW2011_GWA2_53_7]